MTSSVVAPPPPPPFASNPSHAPPLLVQKALELHATGEHALTWLQWLLTLLLHLRDWFVSFVHRTHWAFAFTLLLLALTLVLHAATRPRRKRPRREQAL